MILDQILKNNELWVAEQLEKDPDYFKELSKGQNPDVLFIGCSDSRVTAEVLMGADPGEVFVHRNIANVVPNNDLNSLSVINFAVNYVKVKHIIVCGHYNCGGVKAAMQISDEGLLNPWLRNIRDVYRLHKNELNAIESESERYDRLVELNVYEQCINVIKTRDVQNAIVEKRIQIHGWVFNIRTGRLIDLKIDFQKILDEIMGVYSLFDQKMILK
ncbi:MAG: carbonic anhydrase [Saprospiraceae bacterium]|nr:MAG: carbonate dehydratase [Bacteroidetes bacterium OLB9]MCO6463692.1 carbonic anhydrase [Saprospiraceae bacterium]MCZ2337051.1 carbonic anhydrase [Chitinophagales bacterium]